MYIRYEDVVKNQMGIANEIYSFLGTEMDKSVVSWIKSRIDMKSDNNPFSTNRNSTYVATKWRRKISFEEVLKIQKDEICGTAMKAANYTFVFNAPNSTS